MHETTRFQWMSWMAQMLRHLRSGDMFAVLNDLACNLGSVNPPPTKIDEWGMACMFGQPELKPFHWVLWHYIVVDIIPGQRRAVKRRLRVYGWEI